jgi:tetratricopeptide (TPR) repeat protein
MENFEHAVEMFTTVITLDREHFNALYGRAACLNCLNKMDDAILDYERALELDDGKGTDLLRLRSSPSNESAFSSLGRHRNSSNLFGTSYYSQSSSNLFKNTLPKISLFDKQVSGRIVETTPAETDTMTRSFFMKHCPS